MTTETIKISELTPYERNARHHEPVDIDAIAKSIEAFGFRDPVGVWGPNNIIVEGHGRVMAAKQLGMTEVPCIRLDDLTDEQRRAYGLAHNKTAELSTWDAELLPLEMQDLPTYDMTAFGFSDVPQSGSDPDPVIEEDDFDEDQDEIEARVQPGDLWQLGAHRLICGDSTDDAVVSAMMGGTPADMAFTDPPYNCNYGEIKRYGSRKILNDNMQGSDFQLFCEAFVDELKRHVTGCIYMCAGPGPDGRTMFVAADRALHNSTMIVWNKDRFTLGRGKYQNKHEVIWFGWGGSGSGFCDDRTLTNVWDIPRPKKSELHPTMKPVELVATALKHNPGSEIVLDLFGGSGTTLIACEQLGRKCRMVEMDPHYCDVIIARWEKLTGKKAELIRA